MKWWPIVGIKNYFTEKVDYTKKIKIDLKESFKEKVFQKSLHIFVIDCGTSNLLNFTIKALKSPQYNIHRFGIFFTETPRHADLLIILGPICEKMVNPLKETIEQMPEPFKVLILEEEIDFEDKLNISIPNLVARIKKDISPFELLGILLKIQKGEIS